MPVDETFNCHTKIDGGHRKIRIVVGCAELQFDLLHMLMGEVTVFSSTIETEFNSCIAT